MASLRSAIGPSRTFRKIKWKLKLIWETSFLEISAEIKLYSRTFQGEYKDERGGAWAASCERVFALLKNLFGEQQLSALADYIQAALMLNYNDRHVG